MLACDFFVTVTATFRLLHVFVVLEVGTRRLVHWNVTEHPTRRVDHAAVPHLHHGRERTSVLGARSRHRFSKAVDRAVGAMGLQVLKTPIAAPQAKDYASHCTSLV